MCPADEAVEGERVVRAEFLDLLGEPSAGGDHTKRGRVPDEFAEFVVLELFERAAGHRPVTSSNRTSWLGSSNSCASTARAARCRSRFSPSNVQSERTT